LRFRTDPDSALWQYSYDSANRLTTLTDPRSKTTTYAYSTGRVTTVTRADNSTALLTALQLQGIPAAGTGTQSNPATPVLAAYHDLRLRQCQSADERHRPQRPADHLLLRLGRQQDRRDVGRRQLHGHLYL
jgi:YD repeat-containing protein